jgi:hypothetical protein
LNIYGPYLDRLKNWEKNFSSEWIKRGLVVVGGDLNFLLGTLEVWGPMAQVDNLSRYFINKLEVVGLLDIELAKLILMWRNKRRGERKIKKKLDYGSPLGGLKS